MAQSARLPSTPFPGPPPGPPGSQPKHSAMGPPKAIPNKVNKDSIQMPAPPPGDPPPQQQSAEQAQEKAKRDKRLQSVQNRLANLNLGNSETKPPPQPEPSAPRQATPKVDATSAEDEPSSSRQKTQRTVYGRQPAELHSQVQPSQEIRLACHCSDAPRGSTGYVGSFGQRPLHPLARDQSAIDEQGPHIWESQGV